jgi:predicted alpha-1,2-mannosidase
MLHLIFPELAAQVAEGWVNAIREDPDHMLPQWSAPNRLPSMVGSMGEVSMAEAIVNGALSPSSARVAYDYIKKSALETTKNGRAHMSQYISLGFVPGAPGRSDTVATSQNYFLADYAASLAAQHMGDIDVANTLRKRSGGWTHLWEPDSMFFREKSSSGSFSSTFDQYLWRGPYTEGGPWQYRFYVPHDPKGLRRAYEAAGAKQGRTSKHGSHMCDQLVEMMVGNSKVNSREMIHEIKEMQQHCFGQYAHNNQPSHHIMYMFAHAGCALEGQKWIHHTLRTQYTSAGFAGDEDNGEMASWYTLSSLGLYALVPGSGKYQVGAPPLFQSVTIRRKAPHGDLRIRRSLQVYVNPREKFTPASSVSWRGIKHDLASDAVLLSYSELLEGGELVFDP